MDKLAKIKPDLEFFEFIRGLAGLTMIHETFNLIDNLESEQQDMIVDLYWIYDKPATRENLVKIKAIKKILREAVKKGLYKKGERNG